MGWSKSDIDNADLWTLVDIMESGNKDKGPVPLEQLNVENTDFDAIKREMQESGQWPTSS